MSASVQILNSDLNSVPNPAGTEANLTISGVTSTPALHADTVLVQAQVLGGQVYYNYFNNPDSDSFYVWEGTILRMSVGDWNAIRFLEKTGSPVIHYTEKMYNRTASRVSADLIAALDYVNFDWLYNAVVRKTQRDPSTWDPTVGQQEAVADNCTHAIREGIEHIFWPRLTWTDARTVSSSNGAHSIDYAESGLSELRHIEAIYRQDPTVELNPQTMRYRLTQSGVSLFDNPPDTVYVRYRMAAPQLTRVAWSDATAYSPGDVVYWSSTGDCYLCLVGHTNQMPSDVTYWERQVIPAFLREHARTLAFALLLGEDGDDDREVRQRQIAQRELMRLVDREQTDLGVNRFANANR